MRRAVATLLTPLVRFVEWLFGPRAPGIDLALLLFAAGWGGLMIGRPAVFDRGAFAGMRWLPDATWIAFFVSVAGMHAAGLARWDWRNLRCAACLLSAWVWISVSVSIWKVELVPGVIVYGVVGLGALCGAIYLSGQPRKAG